MKQNDLIQVDNSIFRVLEIKEEHILLIDCKRRTMPVDCLLQNISDKAIITDFQALQKTTGVILEDFSKASLKRQNVAHKRFSLIAGLISVIGEKDRYTKLLNSISADTHVSKQTIRRYLCNYLAFQDLSCLLPADIADKAKANITDDEKNFRWALNRWFYCQNRHSLQWTYNQMLRDKYCDKEGIVLSTRPSFNQFRYYYRKTRSEQNYLISRNGMGDYKRNSRPLLGDSIQSRFPNVGVGMLDGTICDIYLIGDSGNVIGRPVLTACIDANTSLCCGYCLSWEAGTYNLRNLMLNTACDKQEWCKKHNIQIDREEWPCSSLPGIMITDKGSEYLSDIFNQITEIGVTLIDLDPFRPDLKPMVEEFFDLIQSCFRNELKGKGVVEKDFGERTNRVDYRKQASITIEQFEEILIRSILYYNNQRTLERYPYTEEMLEKGIKPTALGVWNYKKQEMGSNLIDIDSQQLSLVLLPRTKGRFGRDGLRVNALRYVHCVGNFTDRYLAGGEATVAYSPDDVSRVWLVENGIFSEFHLIEKRFLGKSIEEVEVIKKEARKLIKSNEEIRLQGQIDLSNHIRNIAANTERSEREVKGIRENRKKEVIRKHIEIGGEINDDR